MVTSHLTATTAQYRFTWNQTNDVFRRALGNDISVIAMAADQDPAPAAAAPGTLPSSHRRPTSRTPRAITLSGRRRGSSSGLRVTVHGTIHRALGHGRRVVRIQWYRRRTGWQTVKTLRVAGRRFRGSITLPRSAARRGISLRAILRGLPPSATLRLRR
jgi:hypothetical protein